MEKAWDPPFGMVSFGAVHIAFSRTDTDTDTWDYTKPIGVGTILFEQRPDHCRQQNGHTSSRNGAMKAAYHSALSIGSFEAPQLRAAMTTKLGEADRPFSQRRRRRGGDALLLKRSNQRDVRIGRLRFSTRSYVPCALFVQHAAHETISRPFRR